VSRSAWVLSVGVLSVRTEKQIDLDIWNLRRKRIAVTNEYYKQCRATRQKMRDLKDEKQTIRRSKYRKRIGFYG
jgi:hypothetical protein